MENELRKIANFINGKIVEELEQQGHILSGDIKDIDNEFERTSTGWRIVGKMQHYAMYLEQGVKPDRILFSPGSGAGSSKFIDALEDYARKRGFDNPKSAAFAIAHKMKSEGMPTKGSYKYSTNSRRKEFLQNAFDNNQDALYMVVEEAGFIALQTQIDNIIAREQKKAQAVTA